MGLKPKNKGHTNFYECCDLTKKVYLILHIIFENGCYTRSPVYLGHYLVSAKEKFAEDNHTGFSEELLNEAFRSPNHKICFSFALKCLQDFNFAWYFWYGLL